jgi:hypothetical protein
MAKLNVNIGLSVNDKTGDTLRSAFDKINQNFTELYTLTGGTSAALIELAQDYAAPLFNHASHTNITATYDDANNKILLTGVASAVWPVANTNNEFGPTRIAIGNSAGGIAQGSATVAVGSYAGNDTQGGAAVAIGTYAGTTTQRNDAIAIGYLTGNDVQGTGAVSIGRQAGQTSQGAYSIAIGKLAGQTSQAANTIILNSTNSALNGVASQTNSFYVSPIRSATATSDVLYYNTTTKEITYAAAGSVSSLVNGAKTVSLGTNSILTLPAPLALLTSVSQLATDTAKIYRATNSTDLAAIQTAWETWYGNEQMFREMAYQDGQTSGGSGPTRPWAGLPSWEAYPLIMNYVTNPPGGSQLPPPSNLGPAAKVAQDSYLAYKELVSSIDIVNGNKTIGFDNTGLLSLPGKLEFKDTANAKIILKTIDPLGYVVEDPSQDKAWTFNANGSLTFPNATVQTTAWTGSVSSLVNGVHTLSLGSTGNTTFPTGLILGAPRGVNTVNFTCTVDKEFQIETGTSSTSKLWQFGTTGTTTFPSALTLHRLSSSYSNITADLDKNLQVATQTSGGRKEWTFGTTGSLTFPDGTNQTGKSVTVPMDQVFDFNLSFTNPSESTRQITIGQYGLITDNIVWQFETADSKYWNFHSEEQKIESSESTGCIKFGTATKDNTGAFTDIELFSFGTGDGTNAVYISAGSSPTNNRWKFGGDGELTLPASGDVVDSTSVSQLARRVEGSWTVTNGTSTYSFTVPMDGTYTMWVKGNIPNGIITWNATLSISNINVPAIGTQYAWNYTGGGSPILLTAIPNQIRGSAGTISTDNTYAGTTSNRFDFGISNTSGANQTIYYGYIRI